MLRESEEKFRSLFENSLDGIFCTAFDGRILNANVAACRIIGATEQEICTSGRDAIVNINDLRVQAALGQRARTGKFQVEQSFKRKDGALSPVQVSSSLFTNAKGETLANRPPQAYPKVLPTFISRVKRTLDSS
ncbi:MAG: PAS domain S-box protein [Desulfomonilaceae bacterium]